MKKFVFLMSCLFAAPLFAADTYVGLGGGGSRYEASFDELSDSSSTWEGFVGYNVTPALALELGYHDLGDFSDEKVSVEADMVSLTALGSFSVGGETRLYGKVGVGLVDTDVTFCNETESNDSTEILIGGGASFQASERFGVRAEVLMINLEDTDSALVYGVAGTYSF